MKSFMFKSNLYISIMSRLGLVILIQAMIGHASVVNAQDQFDSSPAHHMESYPSQGGDITYELMPQDRGWAYDESFRNKLSSVVTNTWFRLEFLDWNIRSPGNSYMSETVPGVAKPNNYFTGEDLVTNSVFTNVKVPDFDDVFLNNNFGLRGTFGVNFGEEDFVANVWFLRKNDQLVQYPDVYSQNRLVVDNVIGIGTLFNGNERVFNPLNNAALVTFNTDFRYRYETTLMGAEANYLYARNKQAPGMQIRGLFGVRYIHFTEQFEAYGVNVNLGPAGPLDAVTRNAYWESRTNNNIVGPQIGFQSELVTDYFTLGMTPKVMLGFNRINYAVKSSQFLRNTDGFTHDEDNRNQVSPVVDLLLYGKVPLTPHFKLIGSYQVTYIGMVSRPFDTIRYNVITPNGESVPDLKVKQDRTDILVNGVSVGFEATY